MIPTVARSLLLYVPYFVQCLHHTCWLKCQLTVNKTYTKAHEEISLLLTEFMRNCSKGNPQCLMYNRQGRDAALQISWGVEIWAPPLMRRNVKGPWGHCIIVQGKEMLILQSLLSLINVWYLVRFEVFTAVAMKNDVFWDVTPCGSCKNRLFGWT
jgi:hypothetical protein